MEGMSGIWDVGNIVLPWIPGLHWHRNSAMFAILLPCPKQHGVDTPVLALTLPSIARSFNFLNANVVSRWVGNDEGEEGGYEGEGSEFHGSGFAVLS